MRKIKLSFISFLAYPLFNEKSDAVFGGAEIDAYNLAKKLAENEKYDITFYVGDFGQKQEERYGSIKVRKFSYMNLEKYTSVSSRLLRRLNIISEVLKMDCDVCFVEAYNEMLGWVALLPGRLKGSKTIFRLAHDLDTDLEDAAQKGRLYHFLYRYGIYRADSVISQTEIQKELLKSNLDIDSRVIKNGFFIQDEIPFDMKKTILWVARAQSWKRPELFLQLVKQLPEEQFVMVMPGENDLQKRIKEEARLYPNLRFVDFVPFARIQQYYNEAKLFVNTSEYEGFPNAFVQACLGKTPILSFNVNPDSFIEVNGLGYFCSEDMDKAVHFIKSSTTKSMADMGEKAMSYVKRNHDISSISLIYEEIIRNLMFELPAKTGVKEGG